MALKETFVRLYQRKDSGSFYLHFTKDGKRFRLWTGKDKAKAESQLRIVQLELLEGLQIKRLANPSLSQLVREYLNYVGAMREKKSYESFYRPKCNAFLRDVGSKRLSNISTKDIEDYIAKRKNAHSVWCAAGDFRALRAMFNWARKHRYISENPCTGIAEVRTPRGLVRFLEKEEVNGLLSAAEGTHLYPLIATAVHTGLRQKELVYLEWEDFDWKRNLVYVRNKPDKGMTLKSYQERTVPLRNRLREILLPYRREHGWCFTNAKGKQYTSKLEQNFNKIRDVAGVPGCSIKTLRHTFASHLVMAGVSIFKVSQWLGHASVKTTMIYAHLSPQDPEIDRVTY
jgi:integrase